MLCFNITAGRRVTVNQPVHGISALAANICKSSVRAPANQEHLWTVAKNRWQNQLLAVTYLRAFGELMTQYRQTFWLKSHESSYQRTWSASQSSHSRRELCQPQTPTAAEAQGHGTEMCFITQPPFPFKHLNSFCDISANWRQTDLSRKVCYQWFSACKLWTP